MKNLFTAIITAGVLITAILSLWSFWNAWQLYDAVKKNLNLAHQLIVEAGDTTQVEELEKASGLLGQYSVLIEAAYKSTSEIEKPMIQKKAFNLIFKKASVQLGELRALQSRPPFNQSYVIERAIDTNMRIQEESVAKLTQPNGKTDKDKYPNSKTYERLKCPDCNIILISLTTLRKDRLGIYGYQKDTSPNIDRFFRDSVRFNIATAPTSWTAPNVVSLFTSLFPYRHGIMKRETDPIYNRKVLTIAQILKDQGYQTAAFTGGGDYNDSFVKLKRGFDIYLDNSLYEQYGIKGDVQLGSPYLTYAPIRSYTPLASEWLKKNHQSKFFFTLQGYDTHCPLDPREPFAEKFTHGLKSDIDFSNCHWTHSDTEPVIENGEKYWSVQVPSKQKGGPVTTEKLSQGDVDYMNALYDARVAEVDYYLNDFLQTIKDLKLERNTIIILMSDHGEMLGENGRFMRGGIVKGTFYEPALNFPLIIKHPNVKEPIVVDDLVQTVDIMPSLLSMLNIPDPQAELREGVPFLLSTFHDSPINKYNFAATKYLPSSTSSFMKNPTEVEAIRDRRWKLIREIIFSESGFNEMGTSYQLFDLENDPGETENVYEQKTAEAERLRNTLESWLERYK